MADKYVVNEQIYRNIESGEISQIRQEMSDGSVEWWYDGGSHPQARPTAASMQRARNLLPSLEGEKLEQARENVEMLGYNSSEVFPKVEVVQERPEGNFIWITPAQNASGWRRDTENNLSQVKGEVEVYVAQMGAGGFVKKFNNWEPSFKFEDNELAWEKAVELAKANGIPIYPASDWWIIGKRYIEAALEA